MHYTELVLTQSNPIVAAPRLRATIPRRPARTPNNWIFFEGNRIETNDEVRSSAVRLPPRSHQTSRPLFRMDLQGQRQDHQRQAQPPSSAPLSIKPLPNSTAGSRLFWLGWNVYRGPR